MPSNPLAEWIEQHPYKGPFKSKPFFNREGKMVEVYFTDESCYGESKDGYTLYLSQKDKSIVGVQIHGAIEAAESDALAEAVRILRRCQAASKCIRPSAVMGALDAAAGDIDKFLAKIDAK